MSSRQPRSETPRSDAVVSNSAEIQKAESDEGREAHMGEVDGNFTLEENHTVSSTTTSGTATITQHVGNENIQKKDLPKLAPRSEEPPNNEETESKFAKTKDGPQLAPPMEEESPSHPEPLSHEKKNKEPMPTFNHRKCRSPVDHRNQLRDELDKEEPSEAVITALVAGHPKTCKYLYMFRYANKRTSVTISPLCRLCCVNPSYQLFRLVYDAYPEAVSESDHEGRLPLHYACRFGACADIIDLLIHVYKDAVKLATKDGVLPLHYACRNQGALQVVRKLIALHPESVKMPNKLNWIPLHYAASGPSCDIVAHLISLYPEGCRARTSSLCLPLHYAANCGTDGLQNVKELLAAYPDGIRSLSKTKQLPLHHACMNQPSLELTRLLVQAHPESVRAVTAKGRTPLQLATERDDAAASEDVVIAFLSAMEVKLDSILSLSSEKQRECIGSIASKARRETGSSSGPLAQPADRETTPGAVSVGRVRSRDTTDRRNDESMADIGESDSAHPTESQLSIAAEVAPSVAEMESELNMYRRRFEKEVVHAEEVVPVANDDRQAVKSNCCIIL